MAGLGIPYIPSLSPAEDRDWAFLCFGGDRHAASMPQDSFSSASVPTTTSYFLLSVYTGQSKLGTVWAFVGGLGDGFPGRAGRQC